jgi:F-type H+-transporting ATPase subunit a
VDKLGSLVSTLLEELKPMTLSGHPLSQTSVALTNYSFFLLVAMVLVLVFFAAATMRTRAALARRDYVPRGVANVAEWGVEFVRDGICVDVMGPEGRKYFPFIGTIFFFILFNNVLGLIPGLKPGTGTMGTTVTWAIMVFIVYNWIGIKKHGLVKYLKSFFPKGAPPGIREFVGVLEIISHFIRPLTLSVRLYANMYAGHVVLGIFSIFVVLLLEAPGVAKAITVLPLMLQIAMYAFEAFVAFIQAYVFTILTSVYIGIALSADEH